MSQDQEELRVAAANDASDFELSSIFSRCFKCIYSILGLSFTKHRDTWCFIFSTLMFLRVIFSLVISTIRNIRSKQKLVLFVNDLAYECFPLVEFIVLSSSLLKFNNAIAIFTRKLNMRSSTQGLMCSMRRLNRYCVFFILTQFTVTAVLTFTLFKVPRNWMVERTFPVGTPLGPVAENIIGHLSVVYETFIKNYIPLSVSFYLCYYKLLIEMKRQVLAQIVAATSCEYIHKRLQYLNNLSNSFEETFSMMPLCWLAYSIGPGLSYALNFSTRYGDWAEFVRKIAFLFRVLLNFVAFLLVLYLISQWQNKVDSSVHLLVLKMEINVQSIAHSHLLNRVTRVMKRRVTVWQTCPIERILILSFIGSALTFSVFFLQLSA